MYDPLAVVGAGNSTSRRILNYINGAVTTDMRVGITRGTLVREIAQLERNFWTAGRSMKIAKEFVDALVSAGILRTALGRNRVYVHKPELDVYLAAMALAKEAEDPNEWQTPPWVRIETP